MTLRKTKQFYTIGVAGDNIVRSVVRYGHSGDFLYSSADAGLAGSDGIHICLNYTAGYLPGRILFHLKMPPDSRNPTAGRSHTLFCENRMDGFLNHHVFFELLFHLAAGGKAHGFPSFTLFPSTLQ